jgi:hypothetical protein
VRCRYDGGVEHGEADDTGYLLDMFSRDVHMSF